MTVSILTLNIQGLRTLSHRQTLMEWLNCFGPDIVCLQETHAVSEDEFSTWFSVSNSQFKNKYKYKCISSPGRVRSCGVAILYKPFLKLKHSIRDTDGRLVIGTFNAYGSDFQLVCLYGPNNKIAGNAFFESFFQALDPDMPILLGGDFNTVVDPYIDRLGCNPNSPWAYNWSDSLALLMENFNLKDCWREKHPNISDFTWRRSNGLQASRIDMFWIPEYLIEHVRSIEIFPFFRSDHSYLFLEIDFPAAIQRGPGVWKFNCSHLQDESFRSQILTFWQSWRSEKQRFSLLSTWWEAGKTRLKTIIRDFSYRKAKKRRETVKSLNATLYHIKRRINSGEPLLGLLAEVKKELETVLLVEAKGTQLRARIQWAEEGESSTAFFLQQEKCRGQQRVISRIKRSDGTIASQTSDIIPVWADFYSSLYKAQDLDSTAQLFFLNKLERRLTSAQAQRCEGPLTLDECYAALKDMPRNKTPGLDGLPAEFYLSFWDLLGNDLVDVLNSCYDTRSLSKTQRAGIITLLYKKDDKLDVKNWRPITLMCVDYKILSKSLANRVLLVIRHLVSSDQSCSVPGRFIGENIRLMHDIVEYANNYDLPGAILSLDQEKAFDRVDWNFMLKVLSHMGFGPIFRSWVQFLYSDANSRVLVNGFLSEAFPVSRGVRQGCPLSPLLYVLVAESLACAIRANDEIDGFPVPLTDRNPKLSQYADDTSVFANNDKAIKALFDLFSHYESASGAKLNRTKCKALLIGSWKQRSSLPCGLQCTSDHIVALGSRIANDGEEDWNTLLGKLKSLLGLWKRRDLSLRGRTIVVKMLGLSKFWFLSTFSIMPDYVLKQINSLIFPFIWGKKREAIKRVTLCQPPSQGGLGITKIEDKLFSLLCLWPKRFLIGEHRWWQNFFEFYLRQAFSVYSTDSINSILLRSSFNLSELKTIPKFYATVLLSWCALGEKSFSNEWSLTLPSGSSLQLKDLSAREAYYALLPLGVPVARCVLKYKEWDLSPSNWKHVWQNLKLWKFIRAVQDTNFSIAHAVLPTKDRLIRFKMKVSPSCHCGANETLVHLFVDCPFAKRILLWFYSILTLNNPSLTSILSSEILLGIARHRRLPISYNALLGIIRHRIWLSRKSATFDGIAPNFEATLAKVKSTFRFLLLVQHRNTKEDYFMSNWLAGGTFGQLGANNKLIYNDIIK